MTRNADGWPPRGDGVTCSPAEWRIRGQAGQPLGVCRQPACGGILYAPREPTADGGQRWVPFHDYQGVRYFEAECDACGCRYTQPSTVDNGVAAVVPDRSDRTREERQGL